MRKTPDGRYAKEFLAGWGMMDFNGHLANTAYLDLAADAVTITHAAAAMSPDGSRFILENEIWSAVGERAARVRSTA